MKPKVSGLMVRLRKKARLWGAVLLIACLPLVKGCYGSFPLTRAVYKLNGDASENKFVRTGVFWIFIIVPFYPLSLVIDSLALNLVEFWSEEEIEITQTTLDDGTEVTLAPGTTRNEAVLTFVSPDQSTRVVRFVRLDDTRIAVYEDNDAVTGYVVRRADGSIDLQDVQGDSLRVLTPEFLTALRLRADAQAGVN